MLVFAVLVDRSGLTCDKGSIVVVNRPEHQLPLFVLTFAGAGSSAGLGAPSGTAALLGLGGRAPRLPPGGGGAAALLNFLNMRGTGGLGGLGGRGRRRRR